MVNECPSRARGGSTFLDVRALIFFHSHVATFNSYKSFEYLPYSTIPPKINTRFPSVVIP
ncbi:hypothetical protein DERP_000186 [Dermatophagoides pteronyssinus]|uniref:Uncharacterized protein n=1 Tax=Dermatophagoides pteronyssinus TaxID=6956 RepID=A0ABQ8IZG5_DERPT|nr:hypothetical protein DERP_000186 [Dermatophagoides pteronyssinus]